MHFIDFPLRRDGLMNVSLLSRQKSSCPRCFVTLIYQTTERRAWRNQIAQKHLSVCAICIRMLAVYIELICYVILQYARDAACICCLRSSGLPEFWTVWGTSLQTKREHSNSIQTERASLLLYCARAGELAFLSSVKYESLQAMFAKIGSTVRSDPLTRENNDVGRLLEAPWSMPMLFNVKRWCLLIN